LYLELERMKLVGPIYINEAVLRTKVLNWFIFCVMIFPCPTLSVSDGAIYSTFVNFVHCKTQNTYILVIVRHIITEMKFVSCIKYC
jgi:hypothetical protein